MSRTNLKVRLRRPVLTEDVDKDFVQVERQQRFFESLEVVPHCPEDVPLKTGVQLLPAVTAIRPWGGGGHVTSTVEQCQKDKHGVKLTTGQTFHGGDHPVRHVLCRQRRR